MKLQLPTVTLMCIDCVDPERAVKVLDICKSKVDFGEVKLLTNDCRVLPYRVKIPSLNSLIMYSVFMLTKVHEYIDTPHVLIVQRDGWILNPSSFDPAWLELDYIGPLFVQYDKVGSGGFSLRSRKIMRGAAALVPNWGGTMQDAHKIQSSLGQYEDGILSLSNWSKDYKIASKLQGSRFAQGGNRNPLYFNDRPFGFHRTWQEIDFKTGVVNSSDLSKDLHISYDYEIDEL